MMMTRLMGHAPYSFRPRASAISAERAVSFTRRPERRVRVTIASAALMHTTFTACKKGGGGACRAFAPERCMRAMRHREERYARAALTRRDIISRMREYLPRCRRPYFIFRRHIPHATEHDDIAQAGFMARSPADSAFDAGCRQIYMSQTNSIIVISAKEQHHHLY